MVLANKFIPDRVGNEFSNTGLATFNKDSLLGGARQITLNGTLGQIVQLVAFSHELFSGLIRDTTNIHNRITNMSGRIQNIAAQLPNVDSFFMYTNCEVLHTQARAEYHGQSVESSQLINASSMPPSLREMHAKTIPPPNFSLLDDFSEPAGTPCLKLYSNPNYFVDEWMVEMEKQRAAAKEKRKEKRKAREEARAKAGLTKKTGAEIKVEAKPIARQRYDPHTGQRIISPEESSPRDTPAATPTTPTSAAIQHTQSSPAFRPQPQPPQPQPQQWERPAAGHAQQPQRATTLRATSSSGYVNVVPQQTGHVHVAPQPSAAAAPQGAQQPAPAYVSSTSEPSRVPNLGHLATAPAVSPRPVPAAPLAPKPPPAAPAPPPPPSAPLSPTSSGGGLAAALLSKGQTLKPAETAKAKPTAQSDLLTQIRSGINLKAGQQQQEESKEAAKPDNSVGAILARRIAIADSDSESEDESETWSD